MNLNTRYPEIRQMIKAKLSFNSENEKKEYVKLGEDGFEEQLDKAAERVRSDTGINLITLAGPSCSGKTTTANKLIHELTRDGRRVHAVSIDDFYLDRDVLNARAEKNGGKIDYDSPSTLDFDTLADCMGEILSNGIAKLPCFDFTSGMRVGYSIIDIVPEDTFIFEGIQALYPEFTALIAGRQYLSLFISLADDADIGGTVLDCNELRFFRRLVRDNRFRGAAPEFTYRLWEGVRANEEKNIYPNVASTDMQINSFMPYEINAIKPKLMSVLKKVPSDDGFFKSAEMIMQLFDRVEAIPESMIPEYSVFREFIGK